MNRLDKYERSDFNPLMFLNSRSSLADRQPTKKLIEQIKKGKKDLQGVNLALANLQGLDLMRADLTGANLEGADLQNLDLRWANLSYAILRSAHLNHADLKHAILTFAFVDGAFFADAELQGADLEGIIGWADFSRADFQMTRIDSKHRERLEPVVRHGESAHWLKYH